MIGGLLLQRASNTESVPISKRQSVYISVDGVVH